MPPLPFFSKRLCSSRNFDPGYGTLCGSDNVFYIYFKSLAGLFEAQAVISRFGSGHVSLRSSPVYDTVLALTPVCAGQTSSITVTLNGHIRSVKHVSLHPLPSR
jgi:hypothetical protein